MTGILAALVISAGTQPTAGDIAEMMDSRGGFGQPRWAAKWAERERKAAAGVQLVSPSAPAVMDNRVAPHPLFVGRPGVVPDAVTGIPPWVVPPAAAERDRLRHRFGNALAVAGGFSSLSPLETGKTRP